MTMNTIRFIRTLTGDTNNELAAGCYRLLLLPERIATGVQAQLGLWQERITYRQTLRDMNEHLLEDVGLTRDIALREAQKPFWRA